MKQIDHNPHEQRPTMRIWWIAWVILAALWTIFLVLIGVDWPSIALGAGSGIILAAWATDLTGNKFMG